MVKETLAKSAEFNVYVRDRKPIVRFTGKAYVLPRTGQRGIPVVSVNTTAVALEIYRIGDRNLLDTVIGRDFQRNLDRYDIGRLTEERGAQVWKGEMKVEQVLNADVTTAFPVGEAIGTLAAGVYVDGGGAGRRRPTIEFDALATQWFIVSDLGLTAFSGNDGIHAFVHSLETTQPKGAVEVRLLSRSNEVLATKRTSDAGHVQFEAGLTRGEGALAPAMLIATDSPRRLRVPQPQGAGLRSQRPRRGRPRGPGRARCLRLCRARRLPLRRERARDRAAARRAGACRARRAAHAGGRAPGRRRVSPHRGGRPGRRRARA